MFLGRQGVNTAKEITNRLMKPVPLLKADNSYNRVVMHQDAFVSTMELPILFLRFLSLKILQ